MIATAKLLTIFLGLSLAAFTIATIVLAVQKASLQDELVDARNKLEEAMRTTTTTTTAAPTTEPNDGDNNTTAPPSEVDYRLPDTLVPKHYNLYLNPDVETGNFSGQVNITIHVVKTTDRIILHAKNLNIIRIYVLNTGSSTMSIVKYYLDALREFLVIELNGLLTAGTEFQLNIEFEGRMLGKIVGLYSSSYLKNDSSRKTIATSKFEPTYARQAYPCFDEPAMKATFAITLVHPTNGGYHALSNMDVMTTQNQGLYNEVFFNKSVPMSTYLTCFIVSDFAYKEAKIDTKGIGDPFLMRVYATPEQIEKTSFALDVGKKVIEYYIDYFQIEYPLPKLDMAAIPDFVSGAMEHWGLVTYRETSVLYIEGTSSTSNKHNVVKTIAHEFAHMWFGNLVTMNWWNDLWLNEGFASYIETKGADAVFPEWKTQHLFISTVQSVMSLDAKLGSHPIIVPVTNPDQITEIFDTITYSKGSSIIRMLEDFLGPENFRQAVTNYLKAYKYRNAVTDDFFTEIEKLGLDFDVKLIMRTWTEQMGLPVVNVEQISDTKYRLTQKRFFSNPNDYDKVYNDSPFNYTWSIPITYRTSTTSDVQRAWFDYNQNEITIELPRAVDWIKFNYDQYGYYYVNYAQPLWENLAKTLVDTPNAFSDGDRASLLNDAFSLADATQLSYDLALDMTKYLSKEIDFAPWTVAASKLASLKTRLQYTKSFSDYKTYARNLISGIYESVGWTVGDDDLQNRLRVTILDSSCNLGLSNCLTEAAKLFSQFLKNPNGFRPHADVRQIVYYYGMLDAGNEQVWNQMWEIFVAETDASEKSKLMQGLSGIQEPWILNRFVQLAWNESYVRSQDYFTCLQYIAKNPVGESIVWDHVREMWPKLVERFGLNERYLGNMIPAITAAFSTKTKHEEMEYFFNKYPEAGAGAAARVRALETVKNNIAWLDNNSEKIAIWLSKQRT